VDTLLGIPSLSKSNEEKRSGLRTLVHFQCGVTIKYCKSPPKNSLKKSILFIIKGLVPERTGWVAPSTTASLDSPSRLATEKARQEIY